MSILSPRAMLTRLRPAPPVPPGFRSTERRTPERPCLNCGDPTPGNFCRTCGQRKVEVHVSLGRMLMEALDDQFSINSALPRTMGALLVRPGHLTREYMSGRIARYIPPFRLYLVTSVLFFLALSLVPELRNPTVHLGPEASVSIGDPEPTGAARPRPSVPDASAAGTRPAAVSRPPLPPTASTPASASATTSGSASASRPATASESTPTPPTAPASASWLKGSLNTGNTTLDSIANARLDHFRRMEPSEAMRQVTSGFLGRVPQMMFVLLPIFAGMLMILYAGSGRYYVEHFVFALHVHASAFVIYLAMIALVRLEAMSSLLLLWLMLYVYLAMKKVYGQGWIVTGLKYGMLGIAYLFLLTLGIGVTLAAAVLLA